MLTKSLQLPFSIEQTAQTAQQVCKAPPKSGLCLSLPPQLPTLQLHRIPSSRVDDTPSYANTLQHLLCTQNMLSLLFS